MTNPSAAKENPLEDLSVPSAADTKNRLPKDFFANVDDFFFGNENLGKDEAKINKELGIDKTGVDVNKCPNVTPKQTITESISATEEVLR